MDYPVPVAYAVEDVRYAAHERNQGRLEGAHDALSREPGPGPDRAASEAPNASDRSAEARERAVRGEDSALDVGDAVAAAVAEVMLGADPHATHGAASQPSVTLH
ncbi:hypothetical protein [Nocardiopsis sp. MG754419]|uniref:hypothetical protein n=1 Tax=Nocardiopsis sp. MG754419 TaxID=2259865 RepID=UPI001BAE2D66|nr:hypothetical protein [Nocardiopsis sp. MG754419]MBR8741040.1 hypothetical protein [Nocardiopsis sp. MG754419]